MRPIEPQSCAMTAAPKPSAVTSGSWLAICAAIPPSSTGGDGAVVLSASAPCGRCCRCCDGGRCQKRTPASHRSTDGPASARASSVCSVADAAAGVRDVVCVCVSGCSDRVCFGGGCERLVGRAAHASSPRPAWSTLPRAAHVRSA
eukprot:6781988-Prymnesium_polylepis.1